ncbi:hypothetical protein [Streptomyces flavidovirens]|uniref:Integral membrane protein n=1 Tax=Streptomyces flavidovirens TaxID=67298 RepID=A0ABW6RQ01_9ACTN
MVVPGAAGCCRGHHVRRDRVVIFTVVSESAMAWAGGGLALGLLAAFIQGVGRAAYDERHR